VIDVRRQAEVQPDAQPNAHANHGAASAAVSTTGQRSGALPPPLDLAAVARGAQTLVDAPLDAMLLDSHLYRRFAGERRQRWLSSVAALLLATAAMTWAADHRRERQLEATNARISALTAAAEPALDAAGRLQRARAESEELSSPEVDPAVVLAQLGALLPKDAFIQRLEWDGSVWRIDGSALDAPRIVPLLDASPAFDDVRIVAASTRFLDAGKQRESFSISFRARTAGSSGGASGGQ
jgi:hypothetical protein